MRRHTLRLLTLLAVLVPGAAQADFAEEQLLIAANPEHEQHAQALDWWKEHEDAEKIALLRRALQSDHVAVARVAAGAVGHPYLDGAEMRRKMELLLTARPLHVFVASDAVEAIGFDGRHVFGADDVVPFFRAVARDPDSPESDRLQTAHRALRTEHADALLPLLETASTKVFEEVLWTIGQLGEADREDRRRAVVARGLLYGLQRLRAERAGQPRPKLADVQVEVGSPQGGGLPAAYVAIAAASHPLSDDGFALGEPSAALSVVAPFHWLRRWTLDLTPGPQDIDWLLKLIESTVARKTKRWSDFGPAYALWAMRGLAGIPGKEGRERILAWAEEPNARAAYAATALAERGAPEAFFKLLTTSDNAGEAIDDIEDLLWLVDPAEARERAVRTILAKAPRDLGEAGPLAPESRMWMARTDAIEITAGDIDRIGDALWRRAAPAIKLAWFHAVLAPGTLAPERARKLIAGLQDLGALGWDDLDFSRYEPLFAELELLAPKETRALLVRWSETQPQARSTILWMLAQLGLPGHEDAMIATWAEWYEGAAWVLGLVPGERIRTFLREKATGRDGAMALPALQGLLVHHGLPPRAAPVLDLYQDVSDDERGRPDSAFGRMLAALDDGDAVAAALIAAEASSRVHLLGHVHDERVTAYLQRLRRERHLGLYWTATAGLAIAGDTAAHAEYVELLRSDRTWITDQLEGDGGSLAADPSLTDLLLERLDSNCCLGWAAHTILDKIYPLPFDSGYGGAGTERTRAWIGARAWKRSPLSDKLIPVRR